LPPPHCRCLPRCTAAQRDCGGSLAVAWRRRQLGGGSLAAAAWRWQLGSGAAAVAAQRGGGAHNDAAITSVKEDEGKHLWR